MSLSAPGGRLLDTADMTSVYTQLGPDYRLSHNMHTPSTFRGVFFERASKKFKSFNLKTYIQDKIINKTVLRIFQIKQFV